MYQDSDDDTDYSFNNLQIGSVFELFVTRSTCDIVQKPIPVNGGTIPVRKLFVNNVPMTHTPQELKDIFKVYGKIVNIGYPKEADGHTRKSYIFVLYFDPKDAERALKAKDVFRRKYRFYIHPADQWHQPLELPNGEIQWFRGGEGRIVNFMNTVQQPTADESTAASVPETSDVATEIDSIQILNDDCLVHIFSFLTKSELIAIERVCKRWRELSLSLWLKETSLDFHKVFVMKPGVCLRTDHFREVLLRCGDHITSLDISHKVADLTPERTLPIISRHCKNLTHLNISNMHIKKGGMAAITATIAENLKSLCMDRCTGLSDSLLSPLLAKATKLEVLSIAKTYINGPSLFSLSKTCKNLNLNFCGCIHKEKLVTVLKSLPNLEVLKLNNIDINPKAFAPTAAHLVVLSLSRSKFYLDSEKTSPSFPCLKILDLSFGTAVTDTMLDVLSVTCPVLEKLDISSCSGMYTRHDIFPNAVTDKGIKHLVKFPKLTWINMNLLKAITSESLEYLAANSRGRFKKLELKSCSSLTDSGPSRLVALCSELTSIDVSRCPEITSNFLKAALDSVKLRTNNIILNVAVGGINIEPFEEHHRLLKINYDLSGSREWFGYGLNLPDMDYYSDDDDGESDLMDEFDWEAQSMFDDDDMFDYMHHHQDWDMENGYFAYNNIFGYDEDDDDDDDDDDLSNDF